MKKLLPFLLAILLIGSAAGCTSGTSCCGTAKSNTDALPENSAFVLATDDLKAAAVILNYFQANTGYIPTTTSLNNALAAESAAATDAPAATDEATESADPAATAAPVGLDAALQNVSVCLLFTDEAVAALEAKGWTKATWADGAVNYLDLTILLAPTGVTVNTDAVTALTTWAVGAEAQYLSEHPAYLEN